MLASTAEPEVNMRPGPGLVVMALAFISGARRSTSQQSNPRIGNSNLPKDEQSGFLAQLNPWLSACDVANPITAPDLQEAYRRWVCSTLIPYIAEPIDIRQSRNEENKENTNNNNNNNNINYNNNVNYNNEPNSKSLHSSLTDERDEKTQVGLVSDDPVVFKVLNRSKRKTTEVKQRKRIRPCLKICQTVEERCPYLLTGDRSPGYNTQYAGEPTFLCNDPNIPETDDQLAKSNNGPDSCCYEYCDPFSTYMGVCAYCYSFEVDPADSPAIALEQHKQLQQKQLEQQQQQQPHGQQNLLANGVQTIDQTTALQKRYEKVRV